MPPSVDAVDESPLGLDESPGVDESPAALSSAELVSAPIAASTLFEAGLPLLLLHAATAAHVKMTPAHVRFIRDLPGSSVSPGHGPVWQPDVGRGTRAAMRFLGASPLASFALATLAAACSSSSSPPSVDAGERPAEGGLDAGRADGGDGGAARDAGDGGIDKTKGCASTFGQAIGTVGFARFDGTVVAVLPPDDQACAEPNSTHLILEMSFSGAVYRMVIDVDDTAAPGSIHGTTLAHAMVGGPWADGWHAAALDYVSTFGLHAASLPAMTTAAAVAKIAGALDLGAHVSVFATAQGEADSAHLVHRNLTGQDGAIVVDVDGSPTWLLFAFSDQTF
jgi:hypothetical protein